MTDEGDVRGGCGGAGGSTGGGAGGGAGQSRRGADFCVIWSIADDDEAALSVCRKGAHDEIDAFVGDEA